MSVRLHLPFPMNTDNPQPFLYWPGKCARPFQCWEIPYKKEKRKKKKNINPHIILLQKNDIFSGFRGKDKKGTYFPHQRSSSVVSSLTTRLSLGERPVFAPERVASAPVDVMNDPFSYFMACS